MTDSMSLRPIETDRTVAECILLADQVSLGAASIAVVDSREMYDLAADELVAINRALSTLTEKRFSITRPMDEAKAAVMDLFRPATDKLTALKTQVSGAMLTWKKAEDLRAEQARQKAEADRRAEIERQEKAAAEERRKAEELLAKNPNSKAARNALERAQAADNAVALAEIAPLPVAAPVAAKGVGTAKRWKVKAINLAELVKAAAANPDLLIYLAADEVQLNALATALKAHAKVPGVVFEEVESTRVSRR